MDVAAETGAEQRMNLPVAQQDLNLAFREFNQASGVLERSYRDLEARVEGLREELATTRREQGERSAEAERISERFRLLLRVLPAGVIVLDGAGRVRESNAAARDLIGVSIDGELWRELVTEIFAARPDDGPDLRLHSGRYVHLETCSLGAEPGQLLLLNDVTERRELESRVAHLRRLSAIGDMAATLAHQVRTPLASALLYVSGLRTRLGQPGAAARAAAQASCTRLTETLRRLERLVEDLLSFARRGQFEVEVFDLGEVLSAWQSAHGRLLEQRGAGLSLAGLSLAVSPGRFAIAGNREALTSVLDNLIDNAIALGGPENHVTLHLGAADPDRVEICVADVRDDASVAAALAGAQHAVNAVGLYVEHGDETFRAVHEEGAMRIAREAARAGVERLVHVSGIGADAASPSRYVRSRALGEQRVREAFAAATILRPSVLFGPDDAFLSSLAEITRLLPAFPLFGTGAKRLQPVYVDDVAAAVLRALDDPAAPDRTYELGGAAVYSYREIVEVVLHHLGRRRLLLPLPFLAWEVQAVVLGLLPNPPLTRDQIELMRHDNVVGADADTFGDLGIEPRALVDLLPACLPH